MPSRCGNSWPATFPDHRDRIVQRECVGGQWLQRDPAAIAAGVRRSRAHRAGLRAFVLDAPDHRLRYQDQWISCPRRTDFTVDVDAAAALIAERAPDVLFITSPNNPTGGSLPLQDIRTLVQAAPGIVVVDEAYAEFSDRPSAIGLIDQFPAQSGGGADHVEGLRVRRWPAGISGRRTGGDRRVVVGAAALSPFRR